MGNNSVPKFIFRLSRFPVYRGVRFRQVLLYIENNCASSWSFTMNHMQVTRLECICVTWNYIRSVVTVFWGTALHSMRRWYCWNSAKWNNTTHSLKKNIQTLFIIWRRLIRIGFPPGATTPPGVVFYSPLAGFSLLAYEVSWSHTTTRHSR